MPTDTGDADCMDDYLETCSRIHAMCADCDTVQTVIAGEFNCHVGSRFDNVFFQLASDNNLIHSDLTRLNTSTFTYCGECSNTVTWIDHILCSPTLDSLVHNVNVLYDYVTADNKPVLMGFSNIGLPHSGSPDLTGLPRSEVHLPTIRSTVPDWQKADAMRYQTMLHNVLRTVDVPTFVFDHIRGDAVSSDIMSAIWLL